MIIYQMCFKVSRSHKIPNLRAQPLFLDISKKDFRFLTYFVLHVFRNSSWFSRYLGKKLFRGLPLNSLKGPFGEKM